MAYGKPQVLIFDDYIFIVQRIDGFADSTNYYSDYRSDCLKAVSSDKFAKLLDSWYKDLSLKDKTGVQKRCYNKVMSTREN